MEYMLIMHAPKGAGWLGDLQLAAQDIKKPILTSCTG